MYYFLDYKTKPFFNLFELPKLQSQVNLTLALDVLNDQENIQTNAAKLGDSFYWLNELAEILNPYLDLE
ncbi:hypothetical protein HNP37_002772 [Flavobacterium nitrogenifigens]|uniref:Uncharacterized protein n=2 Tax=Flavobacterium TaxID=237 RepID=A0A7W7N8R7_9FLAO|nr:hypothetical protein [Flavobacterium notoginsengisoli]MBB4802697.1 hypothetical protein [Flavobacterium nitrogenifigens]MBB6387655.1 hypothetical protein [Flavobacterium notoginsengisoli]